MKKGLFILVLIITLGCSSNDENSNNSKLQFSIIGKGNLYGNGAEGIPKLNSVISESTTWSSLITQMNALNNVSDNFSETDIDFSEYLVVAIFDEVRGNGGYQLDAEITTDSENIVIKTIHLVPEGNATTVITQPFLIVKIPKTDLPIIFE